MKITLLFLNLDGLKLRLGLLTTFMMGITPERGAAASGGKEYTDKQDRLHDGAAWSRCPANEQTSGA
jgi:hypothetical protein